MGQRQRCRPKARLAVLFHLVLSTSNKRGDLGGTSPAEGVGKPSQPWGVPFFSDPRRAPSAEEERVGKVASVVCWHI